MSDREPGVSIWLPSYWISQPGVEEAKLILCAAWPHKHPRFLGRAFKISSVTSYSKAEIYYFLNFRLNCGLNRQPETLILLHLYCIFAVQVVQQY